MVWYFLEFEIYVISYFLDMKNNSFTLRLFRHTSTFPAKFIPRIDPKSSHEKSNRKSSFAYCCRRTFGLCTPARAGGSLKIKKPVPLTILAKNVFTRTFNYYQVTSFTKQIHSVESMARARRRMPRSTGIPLRKQAHVHQLMVGIDG